MEICKLAEALSLAKYPPEMEGVTLTPESMCICDPDWVTQINTQYPILGEYLEAVRAGARDLQRDTLRLEWGRACVSAIAAGCKPRSFSMPATDGTPAGDMLALLVLLAILPKTYEMYRSRGIPEDILTATMDEYRATLALVEQRSGRPSISSAYYHWLCHYADAMIFRLGGLNFEMRPLSPRAFWLRNKEDGRLVPVMLQGEFHRTGLTLGSADCEDPEGSFTVEFTETDTAYCGHTTTENCLVCREATVFPKEQWEKAAVPGDSLLAVHIPRQTRFSPESVDKDFREAMALARKMYPEFAPIIGYSCDSWLLDPNLEAIVGPESNIVKFGARFSRHPVKSAGRHVFSFVFPAGIERYEDLPENTRLERGLKQLYLSGGRNYAYMGISLL